MTRTSSNPRYVDATPQQVTWLLLSQPTASHILCSEHEYKLQRFFDRWTACNFAMLKSPIGEPDLWLLRNSVALSPTDLRLHLRELLQETMLISVISCSLYLWTGWEVGRQLRSSADFVASRTVLTWTQDPDPSPVSSEPSPSPCESIREQTIARTSCYNFQNDMLQ